MRFQCRSKTHVSVDNIALTDIVMNLFLFFFITFSLFSTFQAKRESPLKVHLPTLSSGPVEAAAKSAQEIWVSKSGDLFWNGARISREELKEKLKREANQTKPIALRVDREASVQALTSVLEIIRDTGTTNVSLQTQIDRQKS